MRTPAAIASLALLATNASALDFIVDPTQSSVVADLTAEGLTDSDTSPVSGLIDLSFDNNSAPTQATLNAFDVATDEDLDFLLNGGFLGSVTANATGIRLFSAEDFIVAGPVPVDPAGNAAFPNVVSALEGDLAYTATGLICVGLQTNGTPCSDNITLDPSDSLPIDVIDIAVAPDTNPDRLRLDAVFDTSLPFAGGQVDLLVTIVAFADLPATIPGDTDNDGFVGPNDLFTVLANFGQTVPGGPADGDVFPVGTPDATVGPDDLFTVLGSFGTASP